MSTNPFDWLNSINDSKVNLINEDPLCEKNYLPYMVNRGLSYFPDTILLANEMNRYGFLDKKLQYEFHLNSVSKRKRFSKWSKKEDSANIALVKEYYNVSQPKAEEILSILTDEQLQCIAKVQSKGGK